MSRFIRGDLAGFKAYAPHDQPHTVKLDANESPLGLPENVKQKFVDWFMNEAQPNRYPDTNADALRTALACFWGVSPENIFVGLGSDQVIECMCKAWLSPGDAVVVPSPSFSMYGISARLNHGKVVKASLSNDFAADPSRIIAAANESGAKIIFLCTPNNPTGGAMSLRDVEAVVKNTAAVVAVDEAYGEYAGQTALPLVHKYNNCVILRTMSKAYGLAGIRVGYAIGPESLIGDLFIVKPPYNIPEMSQKLALLALTESEAYKKRAAEIIRERDRLFDVISKLEGITAARSDANFIYLTSRQNLPEIFLSSGILARDFSDGDGYKVRLTVGTPEQNDAALTALIGGVS